ncbi:hypothetical protein C4C37_13205 [Pseudomonas amygdali pv. lachrymans]|uniref:hypothetical protein n=1 Tax=Pseudomonas amygdali TaxID=47877 RepID=UPI000B067BB0|nr:hypothetical protein [Pseudomonas amygdali]PWD04127.1 hypothetical protein CX658_04010 [Pseudomonas amygdali pv. lachrymans]QWA48588.1 hypothetical protein C4C37_18420 [Pseudomonas amygdali pv. lachrymans]QWA52527.1 hypothetical protein C4C37_13205 [Pseudomonas amygdali pv. lachrymans]RMM50430.1 hypothetical protein ALQ79_200495 [Pseudomonas amygdali pv. lachrymans]WIO56307.1 hypothetical protein QO021_17190 [Pseudomonas amygdali pv. lachrymans]
MNIGKFDISNWKYDGRKLNHPLTIVRRMLFFPFWFGFRVLYCVAIAGGLGVKDAKEAWRDTK